jgi:hypothetical protein
MYLIMGYLWISSGGSSVFVWGEGSTLLKPAYASINCSKIENIP